MATREILVLVLRVRVLLGLYKPFSFMLSGFFYSKSLNNVLNIKSVLPPAGTDRTFEFYSLSETVFIYTVEVVIVEIKAVYESFP